MDCSGMENMDTNKLDKMPQQICEVFKRKTGHNGGHVHFIYKDKKDHLVLIFHNERLKDIVAKNKDCKKGESIEWASSEFSSLSPKEAFIRFSDQIEKIIIDGPGFLGEWSSMIDFLDWLNGISE